ncbi:MAG: hypothetical protein DSY42_06210 [Aquifex sp.]|nr:MAG: hypothetical protein DSY42_06210 [Aquifex sp.]
MSGIHAGVQKKIKELNPKALFVPCANHSLNLCGVHSFGKNPVCVTFFGTVERLYCFFALSTHRWEVLKENMDLTVKKLSQTRWSAHHDAVKPLKKQFGKLIAALETLTDHRENVDTRGSAECLLKAVCDFSFLGFLSFWCDILEEVNLTQKYLQTEGISLEKCNVMINGLKLFLTDQRNEIVEKAIVYASQQCEEMGISMEKRGRIKRKKRMPGELAKDAGLTVEEEMRRSMLECIDQFSQELNARSEAMNNVLSTFTVIQPHNLLSANEQQLQESISSMTKIFDEISEDEVKVEIVRLRRHLKAAKLTTEEVYTWTVLQFLKFIVKWDFGESLPNLSLCLRLFLTICVSVASCERSFSKLKLIKNYLRSTMSQARLNSLAIISIENERAKNVNFDDVIDKFADAKARRMSIKLTPKLFVTLLPGSSVSFLIASHLLLLSFSLE